jgi:NitT/TauT family transport system substrate-binding protein
MIRLSLARAVAVCGVSAVALVAAAAPVAAQTAKLKVSIIPIVDVAPLFAAAEQGYFAAEGLEVDPTPVVGGAAGIPGAIAGAYDIVYTNVVSTLQARRQGLDIRVLFSGSAAGSSPPDTAGLIKRKGDPIATGRDLEGKVMAVNQRNNINWLFAAAWIKKTGGDPAKVNYREVPFPQMPDAVKIKQADAAHTVDPFMANALRDPALELLGWPWSSVLPGVRAAHWIATGETVEKRPELLRKWVRAMRKGAAWLNANNGNEAFYKLIGSYTRLNREQLQTMKIRNIETDIDVPDMRRLAGLMREHGLLDRDLDLEPMVFNTP